MASPAPPLSTDYEAVITCRQPDKQIYEFEGIGTSVLSGVGGGILLRRGRCPPVGKGQGRGREQG